MLELAANLGFLDESAYHDGLVLVTLEQDLHGEVAAQVGVAPLSTTPIPPRATSPKSTYRSPLIGFHLAFV